MPHAAWVLASMAATMSFGKVEVPSGLAQTELRAPARRTSAGRASVLLVAHSMNFQALALFSELSLIPSAHDGML